MISKTILADMKSLGKFCFVSSKIALAVTQGEIASRIVFSSPEPTILLACGRNRELWLVSIRESRTSGSSTQTQKFETIVVANPLQKCTFTATAHISELARGLDACIYFVSFT